MPHTFAELIAKSQNTVEMFMREQDYNPITIIQVQVAIIAKELTADDLCKLLIERPSMLGLKPPRDYYAAQLPSGSDILRACVQMEIESSIDMCPFSSAVNNWVDKAFQPPEHLLTKMKAIANAAQPTY